MTQYFYIYKWFFTTVNAHAATSIHICKHHPDTHFTIVNHADAVVRWGGWMGCAGKAARPAAASTAPAKGRAQTRGAGGCVQGGGWEHGRKRPAPRQRVPPL